MGGSMSYTESRLGLSIVANDQSMKYVNLFFCFVIDSLQ